MQSPTLVVLVAGIVAAATAVAVVALDSHWHFIAFKMPF